MRARKRYCCRLELAWTRVKVVFSAFLVEVNFHEENETCDIKIIALYTAFRIVVSFLLSTRVRPRINDIYLLPLHHHHFTLWLTLLLLNEKHDLTQETNALLVALVDHKILLNLAYENFVGTQELKFIVLVELYISLLHNCCARWFIAVAGTFYITSTLLCVECWHRDLATKLSTHRTHFTFRMRNVLEN